MDNRAEAATIDPKYLVHYYRHLSIHGIFVDAGQTTHKYVDEEYLKDTFKKHPIFCMIDT